VGKTPACIGGGPAQADWFGWAGSQDNIQRIKILILKFQMNWDFGRTLRNFTRRFRRNLDTGILPKLF
jgi:hypothetical protein